MSEAFSSFLISVGIIVGIALFVPCLELLVRLLRRGPRGQDVWDRSEQDERGRETLPKRKGAKGYLRTIA